MRYKKKKKHQKGYKVRISYFKTQWGDFRQPRNSSQSNKAEWLKVICFPESGWLDWMVAVPPTNTQGGVGKKKHAGAKWSCQTAACNSPKGGIESARMPGDTSVCMGRLGDKSERDKLLLKKEKKNHVDSRFAAVLEELVVFFNFNHTVGDVI